jgi:hypothetical protein
MAKGYFRRPGAAEGSFERPSNTIQIFLRHHVDPEGKFTPRLVTCSDYTPPGTSHVQKGCGGSVWRYLTYPREKAMRFDGPPVVVQQFPVRQDGAVIALVSTDNVHYSTCPAKHPAGNDSKQAASGF